MQLLYFNIYFRGAWVAQSVEWPTLDFGSGHDLTVRGFEPCLGLCTMSTEPASDPLSLSLSLSLSVPPLLSLSKINKHLKKQQQIPWPHLLESNSADSEDLAFDF